MQKTVIIYLVASLFFCFHSISGIDVTNCGSYWTFENVTVENCAENAVACVLPIGKNTSISFAINTGKNNDGTFNIVSDIVNDVAFYVRDEIRFELSVTPEEPCEILKCPLSSNYSAEYSALIYVDPIYEPLYATFKWIMKTARSEQILCFSFPVVISDTTRYL